MACGGDVYSVLKRILSGKAGVRDEAADKGAAFLQAMRLNANAVSVITTHYRGKNYGFTALSMNSLSVDPPAVFLAVGRKASAHDALMQSRNFAVNILGVGQSEIAKLFSDQARRNNRFTESSWSRAAGGAPFIEGGTAANLQCRLDKAVEAYTHTIIVGLVTHVTTSGIAPLVYSGGVYGRMTPLDEA